MLEIKKGPTPRELAVFQGTEGASYGSQGFPREVVYKALLKEQGYLCAYCMKKITEKTIHIEHWIPQRHPQEGYSEYSQEDCDRFAIDYQNMLGVCPGGKGSSKIHTTCDSHRGNAYLFVNPLKPWMMVTLQYERDGKISSTNEKIDKDLTDLLNLNEASLKANRSRAWEACKKVLMKKKKTGTWTVTMIDKQIAHYEQVSEEGYRLPYAGIVLYWLRKYRQKAK